MSTGWKLKHMTTPSEKERYRRLRLSRLTLDSRLRKHSSFFFFSNYWLFSSFCSTTATKKIQSFSLTLFIATEFSICCVQFLLVLNLFFKLLFFNWLDSSWSVYKFRRHELDVVLQCPFQHQVLCFESSKFGS